LKQRRHRNTQSRAYGARDGGETNLMQQGVSQDPPPLVILQLTYLNCVRHLERLDVRCLPALRPLHDVKLHGLTFLQTLEAT